MSRWSKEIEQLDPAIDYERIVYLLSAYEFAWDIEKALEFALFRTYGIPSISGLLSKTGAFRKDTQKRYDDTELLLAEIAENGQDSPHGQSAMTRINEMHGRYRISNDDMLYVLSTFVTEPKHWLDRFGRRAMTTKEINATVFYYRALGAKMGISNIPQTFDAFDIFKNAYEVAYFQFAKSNAEIAEATRDLLLSFYLPRRLVPIGRPIVSALCDPPLRQAMGFPDPPFWLENLAISALKLRAQLLRVIPARRRPRLVCERRRKTYPKGYQIAQLGTFMKDTGKPKP
ncbi:MAG: hypothetical protein ACJAXK_000115 [Yoonia sp.]|jgi:hypothetical protein